MQNKEVNQVNSYCYNSKCNINATIKKADVNVISKLHNYEIKINTQKQLFHTEYNIIYHNSRIIY